MRVTDWIFKYNLGYSYFRPVLVFKGLAVVMLATHIQVFREIPFRMLSLGPGQGF